MNNYRFNGGRGAATCAVCRVIVDDGMSGDEYRALYPDDTPLCWRHTSTPLASLRLTRLLCDLELFLSESRDCIGCEGGPGCINENGDVCVMNERRDRLQSRIMDELHSIRGAGDEQVPA